MLVAADVGQSAVYPRFRRSRVGLAPVQAHGSQRRSREERVDVVPSEPPPATGPGFDLRAIYDAYGAELYRFAYRLLGDVGIAEEAVQDTFLRAWRGASSYDPTRASLRTWLYAIARNVVIDLHRKRAARPVTAELSLAASRPATDDLQQLLAAWQVEEALRGLSAEHRQAIVETYYRDRPYDELSAETGVPVGTLRSRVFHGLRAMRTIMLERGWTGVE